MYIANRTRPDLLVATSGLASNLHAPERLYMVAVKGIIRYLIRTKGKRLVLKPGGNEQLTAYADSSWGNAYERERRSRTGMIVKFGNAVIVAATNLKICMSLSFSEAEYVALTESIKTVIRFKNVLRELGVSQAAPRVFQDNVGYVK